MFGRPRPTRPDDTVGLKMNGVGPTLHSPPPLGQGQAEPDPAARDVLAVSIRNQAIDRMVLLNRNHARVALETPGPRICPHSVAFLYLDTVPPPSPRSGQPLWRKVVAATRIVPDTPDVRVLPMLLFRLARLARERYVPTPGGFDPAVHMSVYHDASATKAEYIGVGVSTLDTPAQPWEQACAKAEDIDDLGGRMYVLLADQTAMLVDRPSARTGRRDLGIHSTGDLNYLDALANRMWTGHHNVSTMPAEQEVWDLMYELHQVTYRQNPRPTL
jgi:hypothetical protein